MQQPILAPNDQSNLVIRNMDLVMGDLLDAIAFSIVVFPLPRRAKGYFPKEVNNMEHVFMRTMISKISIYTYICIYTTM